MVFGFFVARNVSGWTSYRAHCSRFVSVSSFADSANKPVVDPRCDALAFLDSAQLPHPTRMKQFDQIQKSREPFLCLWV